MSRGGRSLAVIGGTGFFGKSFLDAFRRGLLTPWGIERLIAVARNPVALHDTHPELIGDGVELVALDIATAAAIPHADYIVHAANTSDARRYASDPLAERIAIIGAADSFVRRVVTDCPNARIVYTSSGAVYGQQPAGVVGLDENAQLADAEGLVAYKRDYAESKRLAEAAIATLGTDHDVNVSIARCFAFVGAYLPRDQHFAIGSFLGDALAGRAITVNAQHPVIRSYMHADDLVRWLMTIAEHASPACPIYNVGSDEAVAVSDLAQRIAKRLNVAVNMPDQSAMPVDRYVPSISKAVHALGTRLELDLDHALNETIQSIACSTLVRPVDSATGVNHIPVVKS